MDFKPTRIEKLPSAGDASTLPAKGPQVPGVKSTKAEKALAKTPRFRPAHCPPMLLLCVLDDGQDTGEWFRIRNARFVVGRSEGDLIIPRDSNLSSCHFEFQLISESGRYQWQMNDLDSTNGVFVRTEQAALEHGQELWLGGRRYRFNTAQQGGEAASGPVSFERDATSQQKLLSPTELQEFIPSLEEISGADDPPRHLLAEPEQWFGSDPDCKLNVAEDPFLEPRLAGFSRDDTGWTIRAEPNSLNGVWLRTETLPIRTDAAFQAGEHRFLVKVP